MRRDAQPPTSGIYRPRNPRVSPLYQCARRHRDELDAAGLVHRPVEAEVLERFLVCGDLHHGFARLYCDQCGHDYLLAYSCKTRCFCPSCHQKRMLAYGEWLEDNLLAPVPHRQYVFALPKLIRPFFRYRRRYLGALCQLVAGLLKAGFKAMEPRGRPAFILYVQTFGDLVTLNPHVHALGFGADAIVNREAGMAPCEHAVSESGIQHTFGTQEMQYLVTQRIAKRRVRQRRQHLKRAGGQENAIGDQGMGR